MMGNCFMTRVLDTYGRTYSPTCFGKLGIGDDQSLHDVAVIQRTTANGNAIRYAVSILAAQGAGPMWTAGKLVDDMIAAAHGG